MFEERGYNDQKILDDSLQQQFGSGPKNSLVIP